MDGGDDKPDSLGYDPKNKYETQPICIPWRILSHRSYFECNVWLKKIAPRTAYRGYRANLEGLCTVIWRFHFWKV